MKWKRFLHYWPLWVRRWPIDSSHQTSNANLWTLWDPNSINFSLHQFGPTVCFVVVMHSFIMDSHEVFIDIHQGCFAGTGAIVRLPQCQWSKPDGYGKISQCITTTKHSKAKTVCIFLGIYCILNVSTNSSNDRERQRGRRTYLLRYR